MEARDWSEETGRMVYEHTCKGLRMLHDKDTYRVRNVVIDADWKGKWNVIGVKRLNGY